MAITKPHYITNPEAIAKYSPSFVATSSKKGLLVDPEKLQSSELDDLGVRHAAYNIPLSRILGQTSNEHYPTVYYTYNGKNYAFNGQIILFCYSLRIRDIMRLCDRHITAVLLHCHHKFGKEPGTCGIMPARIPRGRWWMPPVI